ncbi:serine/threonine protein kinase [Burkholderia pseudomallei]|uniref:serine/threonine protein kinase n=1 Tax=Burkholderia pseudomallei TaxID=28450 RepID=UPI0005373A2B|nr:serine/threonine protein kinase [Burkholderia pseudomallei]KGW51052.1 phosphotransferase enzyme family protein [Burkholderia pseudomallei MSHR684]KGX79521.1 phosphotransferase enzyme family protein [Burkholderia pseudomallei MSHR435]AJX22468.1 phosphotransferase enzyme family protein [Burkholderia pseudomallei MSHR491]KGW76889.1 phosphotransferase enzyme family protein [Burkholderia pseudomallei MSHR2990]KGW98655.1 phosphotransferase enzyme family protein [Burkholderia pseudomallei MSHR449]
MNDATSESNAAGASAGLPFAGLTPERVLDALDSVLIPAGSRTDGRLLALNSYENRVYQAGIEDGAPIVAKFYRPQRWSNDAILEEHTFVAELAAREIPAVPPLAFDGRTLHEFDGFRFAIFERRGGRAPELDRRDTLEWLGRFIGRIHAVGATKPYAARPTLDLRTFGYEPRDFLMSHDFVPGDVRPAYEAAVALALEGVERAYERAGDVRMLRAHGDCHPSNVLWTDAGPHFVDFDDSRMAPAVQDLWLLLPGDRPGASRALTDLLAGYEDFCEFDPRELHLIEALRTLRLIHYAAWLARRWDDPAFPAAFPWFNTHRYWEARVLELREQIGAMQEGPLWPV